MKIRYFKATDTAVVELIDAPIEETTEMIRVHELIHAQLTFGAVGESVLDLNNGYAAPAEAWRVLWKRTPAECRIATGLLQAKSPREIAQDARISVHAVRFHIKSMLGKTATRRQAELVLQLSRTAHIDPR